MWAGHIKRDAGAFFMPFFVVLHPLVQRVTLETGQSTISAIEWGAGGG